MTAQILTSELTTLIQDTKRKNAEIRGAAEKSLADLKSLPNTSEAQLAADLRKRPNFVRPFLLSCASKNVKFAGTSIICLQRLVISNGLAVETLKDTLDVLRDCTGLAQDIQLKILQVLPSLLANYASHLQKDLLVTALHICFILLASKVAVISNTAAATLQQLVVAVLGKVAKEDESAKGRDFVAEVPIEDGSISVMSAALDAYRLLDDLCLLSEGDRPTFLNPTSMSPNLGLELIEAMLSNHASLVASHPELVHIIRVRLMPFVIRILSEPRSFSITVRAMRLLPIVFSNMLSALPSECEMTLSLLNHMLDPDASPSWKRVLCMEVYRGIHQDPSLVRSIYAHFDEQESKRSVIKDHLAIIVRLSSEKPAVIGLGAQSTIPASAGQTEDEMDEMAALQADGIGGSLGVAMTLRASTAPGISARLSTMRVPCLDQLDKSDPPQIPPAYLYTLALTCMNSFSEGLARFLLPFTIPSESRSKRKVKPKPVDDLKPTDSDGERNEDEKPSLSRKQSNLALKLPINPLALDGHQQQHQIKTSANMIEACWPALLAAYSTFFHAALDSEYYHALVRSFQKFTQISGLLRLSTPRDAFLTALGKNAVPSAVVSMQPSGQQLSIPADTKESKRGAKSPLPMTPAPQTEPSLASLNTRNLLCLRALLNLGIALGPVLQAAWSIILETLQQADLIINHVANQRRQSRSGTATPTGTTEADLLGDIGNEIAAVRIAATRMLESSSELPDEAFLDVVASMSGLLRNLTDAETPPEAMVQTPGHKASMSTASLLSGAQEPRANLFVVENLGKIVEFNRSRIFEQSSESNGWHIFVNSLLGIVSAQHFDSELRVRAAQGLCDLVALAASTDVLPTIKDELRQEGLVAIARQIDSLNRRRSKTKTSKTCELEIHYMSQETLRSLLEQFGDTLVSGWSEVFTIITSVFEEPTPNVEAIEESREQLGPRVAKAKSPKLVRSSFGSLQLICSDFLHSVPRECLTVLLGAIHSFCSQQDEFNISLTSTSLFCNVSEHLWSGEESLHLDAFGSENVVKLDTLEIQSFENLKAEMVLRLLLLLAEITMDQRPEIRHGAIHAIFRIFDSSGEKLRPEDWMVCQRQVVLTLFSYNEDAYSAAKAGSSDASSQGSSWNEAAIILLDNTSTLFGVCINLILDEEGFFQIWTDLGVHIRAMLQRSNLVVSATVFAALEKILLDIEETKRPAFSRCTDVAWGIWHDGNPASHEAPDRKVADNQPALLAYLHCLTALYPLLLEDLKLEHIKSILEQLQICTTKSSPTAYSDDADNMTALQTQIIQSMQMLDDSIPGAVSELVMSASFFVTIAYNRDFNTKARGPTFVALSKAAMDVLATYLIKHCNVYDIYADDSFLTALQSLLTPISLKYKWRPEGKSPPTWQKATSTAVSILKVTITAQSQLLLEPTEIAALWQAILSVSAAMITASQATSKKPASETPSDETFDIEQFQTLYALLVPALGSQNIPDRLRRSFARSLFTASLIHAPHPADLPAPDSTEILANLASTHLGRTRDVLPSRRTKIAYVCLDALIDLVASHDGSAERVRLAQAAAPFLILRTSVTLKAFVLDAPLRGRMPMTASARRELLYVLRKLVLLECEPRAIPDAPGVASEGKKHLFRVYGLVTRALAVCSARDAEVHRALMSVVETVAGEFGVDE